MGNSQKHNVVLITGSLRRASTNTGLLRAITQLNHQSFSFQWLNNKQFPVFNEDIVTDKGIPSDVRKARDLVDEADAIIFAVPQYNFSISSPMKNTFDWLSKTFPQHENGKNVSPVNEKIACMVSSGGWYGGQKAQKHFRESVSACKVKLMESKQQDRITVKRFADNFFNEKGDVIDINLKKKLSVFLDSFDKWIKDNKK